MFARINSPSRAAALCPRFSHSLDAASDAAPPSPYMQSMLSRPRRPQQRPRAARRHATVAVADVGLDVDSEADDEDEFFDASAPTPHGAAAPVSSPRSPLTPSEPSPRSIASPLAAMASLSADKSSEKKRSPHSGDAKGFAVQR